MTASGLTKKELQMRARQNYGVRVTARMIERYERDGFIPPPKRVGGGYKGGVRGVYPVEDLRTVVALPVVLRCCRRSLARAAVGVWALHDCPVPWQTVKDAVERMMKGALDVARQSPDRAARGLLYGWVGKMMIPGRGVPRRARTDALITGALGQGSSSIVAILEGAVRILGGDPSLVARSLTIYDAKAGQHTMIPDRCSIPAVLESVSKSLEDDARAVRPMVLWFIIGLWSLRSALQRLPSPSSSEVRAFAYSTAPVALALLLHMKAIMPQADWQTFVVNLPTVLRRYVPADGEVMVREYPFRKETPERSG